MLHNPIFKGFNPDPAICRKGDDYYVAVSTFEWVSGHSDLPFEGYEALGAAHPRAY